MFANVSKQESPEQISVTRKGVCVAVLAIFQDQWKHSVNNLLRQNLETPASMTKWPQHVNPNFHIYQQQPNFSQI